MSGERVPVDVTLRLPDGREFVCHEEAEAEYADGQLFWWTEGNGGCDCNRSLTLNRAHGLNLGVKDAEDDDVPCMPCDHTITLVRLVVDGIEQNPIHRGRTRHPRL